MNAPLDDRSARIVRWWVRRYTAGLDHTTVAARRAEIDSDLAEHALFRNGAGWSTSRIVRERLGRTLTGMPGDIGWRHDRLHHQARSAFATSLLASATALAQLALAAYFVGFAGFLFGDTGLADQVVLGTSPLHGFEHYADESGAAIAGLIVATLGIALALAAFARPIAPIASNAVTLSIATLAVMFFWMGVWPLALFVCVGASIDLAVRGQPAAL